MVIMEVPKTLALQAGLVTLETLHLSCMKLETNYMKVWLPTLSRENLNLEEELDCSELDWEEEILKFRSKQRKKRKVVRRVEGIPVGTDPKEFIKYKKCLYLSTIRRWRESLRNNLSPPVINELMQLVVEMYRHNKDRTELGAITLQAVLMSDWTNSFLTASTRFYQSYTSHSLELSNRGPHTRIGHTILLTSLENSDRLTHLALEKVATDPLMELVARTANQLTYLNINNSKVTDLGLVSLCGLQWRQVRVGRPSLARVCKVMEHEKELGQVMNKMPRWERKQGQGCLKLSHLEATGLSYLMWQNPSTTYTEYQAAPLDCGFVAVLEYLPLRILNTEVGGRAVLAWLKGKRRARQEVMTLKLEVLVESHPTPAMLEQLATVCPALKEVRVDWFQFYSPTASSREDWVSSLSHLPALSSLFTSDIDHKTEQLTSLLPTKGQYLTRLHLQELWCFKYSLLRAIKRCCTNLEKLVVLMTCKEVVGAVAQIYVEKDVDIALENSVHNPGLVKLRELHLMGPFGSQLVRFLISGSHNLTSLTLAIEWPDPAFCNVVPSSRRDFLGKDYLQDVMQGNCLNHIQELHFMAQYARGRKYLNKDFALYLIKNLLTLKHFGTIRLWNMTAGERREVRKFVKNSNMVLTIDPDSDPRPSENSGDFRNMFVSNRNEYACSWLPVKQASTFSFFEEVADMFAEPALFWPEGLEDSDEDNSNDDDGDSNDEFEVVDDDDQEHIQVGLDPLCAIQ